MKCFTDFEMILFIFLQVFITAFKSPIHLGVFLHDQHLSLLMGVELCDNETSLILSD
jgi:hypothetical protein